jgi:hypothetical protein
MNLTALFGVLRFHLQEFGPTGKEGTLMVPHPSTNPDGFNVMHVSSSSSTFSSTTSSISQRL